MEEKIAGYELKEFFYVYFLIIFHSLRHQPSSLLKLVKNAGAGFTKLYVLLENKSMAFW